MKKVASHAHVKPRMVSARRTITAGPTTAVRLGVPVGTVIADEEVRSYRNPFRQLIWKIRRK